MVDGPLSGCGEHRSSEIAFDLAGAVWLPDKAGVAYLTEACAPWLCQSYLQVQVGDVTLSMPAGRAGLVLDVLSTLVASARTAQEVT